MKRNFDLLVIGAGIIGLTTATELRRRWPKVKVSVYAKDLDPRSTTSWIAGGQFERTEPPARQLRARRLRIQLEARQRQRPGFHLMEQRRRLGDPQPADQDRYVLMEALLSARSHLLITWSNRDDRKGETLQPSGPVRQWLEWLEVAVQGPTATLLVEHAASPLERSNFLPQGERPPVESRRRACRPWCRGRPMSHPIAS
jgi:glycine/D-amino acid oxidase-like deaminating enzyme